MTDGHHIFLHGLFFPLKNVDMFFMGALILSEWPFCFAL